MENVPHKYCQHMSMMYYQTVLIYNVEWKAPSEYGSSISPWRTYAPSLKVPLPSNRTERMLVLRFLNFHILDKAAKADLALWMRLVISISMKRCDLHIQCDSVCLFLQIQNHLDNVHDPVIEQTIVVRCNDASKSCTSSSQACRMSPMARRNSMRDRVQRGPTLLRTYDFTGISLRCNK